MGEPRCRLPKEIARGGSPLGAITFEKPPRGVCYEKWESHAAGSRREMEAGTARPLLDIFAPMPKNQTTAGGLSVANAANRVYDKDTEKRKG